MTILVVEDNELMRTVWRHYLEPIGAELRFAETMKEAMEQMRKLPPPDLVLLDLVLPDSSQEDTGKKIRRIKEMNENVVIVVVTGMVDPDLKELSHAWGADEFIHKHDIQCQENLLTCVHDALKRCVPAKREKPYEASLRLLETVSGLLLRPKT